MKLRSDVYYINRLMGLFHEPNSKNYCNCSKIQTFPTFLAWSHVTMNCFLVPTNFITVFCLCDLCFVSLRLSKLFVLWYNVI